MGRCEFSYHRSEGRHTASQIDGAYTTFQINGTYCDWSWHFVRDCRGYCIPVSSWGGGRHSFQFIRVLTDHNSLQKQMCGPAYFLRLFLRYILADYIELQASKRVGPSLLAQPCKSALACFKDTQISSMIYTFCFRYFALTYDVYGGFRPVKYVVYVLIVSPSVGLPLSLGASVGVLPLCHGRCIQERVNGMIGCPGPLRVLCVGPPFLRLLGHNLNVYSSLICLSRVDSNTPLSKSG